MSLDCLSPLSCARARQLYLYIHLSYPTTFIVVHFRSIKRCSLKDEEPIKSIRKEYILNRFFIMIDVKVFINLLKKRKKKKWSCYLLLAIDNNVPKDKTVLINIHVTLLF